MPERTNTYTGSDDLLAIGETARALGVTVPTIRAWDAAGRIESTRTPTGHRRFRRSEIARLRGEVAAS